jgi:ketosteroid isomerase-like protein
MTLETTKSAVQRWHTMLQNSDMSMLSELLANDVVFRSPVAYQPYVGKQVVFFILTNVIQVFENFTYHREFYTEEVAMLYLSFPPMWEIKNLKELI